MLTHMKRLTVARMAQIMIQDGGGIGAAIQSLATPGRIAEAAREAEAWAKEAVGVVRLAAEPNPWKNATDEEIARELMKQIDERKKARSK